MTEKEFGSAEPCSDSVKYEEIKTPLTTDSGIGKEMSPEAIYNEGCDTPSCFELHNHEFPCQDFDMSPKTIYNDDCAIGGSSEIQNQRSTCESNIEKYRSDIIERWGSIKENMDATSISRKFQRIGWLTQEINYGNIKRLTGAEFILLEVVPKLKTVKDIETFEGIVGPRIKKIIDTPCEEKQGHFRRAVDAESTQKLKSRLQNNKEEIVNILKLEDIVKIKDMCLERRIINFIENSEICRNEFYANDKAIVSRFIDMIIDRTGLGSYSCIISILKSMITDKIRGKHVKQLLKTIKSDLTDGEESIGKKITVHMKCQAATISTKEFPKANNVEVKVSFESNEEGRKLYEELVGKNPEYYNLVFTPALGAQCIGSKLSSVIICLQSLDGKLISRLKNCVRNRKMEKIIQMLFSDVTVEKLLTPGTHKLLLEVKTVECTKERSCRLEPYLKDMIADNKSFLIDEIDTELTLKAFEEKVQFSKEALQGDRHTSAVHIIDVIIKNNFQKEFLKHLEDNNQTYIIQRLKKYEHVYNADTTYLVQNVLAKFPILVKNVDLNEIIDVFIERHIFKEELFINLNEKCDNNRENVMVNFLIEVLQSGTNAILTFIDALFIIQKNDLATTLLNSTSNEVILTGTDEDLEIQWSDALDDNVVIKLCFNMVVNRTENMIDPIKELLHGENACLPFKKGRLQTISYSTESAMDTVDNLLTDETCTDHNKGSELNCELNCDHFPEGSLCRHVSNSMEKSSNATNDGFEEHSEECTFNINEEFEDLVQRNVNEENGISPLSFNQSVDNIEECLTLPVDNTYDPVCVEYKNKVTQTWIKVKDSIHVSAVIDKMRRKAWIKHDEFTNVHNNPRFIEVERLLIHALKQITSAQDITQFEEILDDDEIISVIRNATRMAKSHASHRDRQESTEKMKKTLQQVKEKAKNILTTVQVIQIKDNLLQCDILKFDENEKLLNNDSLLDMRNNKLVCLLMDKAIEKVQLGSFFCVCQCFCEFSRSNILTSLFNDNRLGENDQHRSVDATLTTVSVQNVEKGSKLKEPNLDMLECNRSFLVREMDTKLILKAFTSSKKRINMDGINVHDRQQTANHIIDEMIKNKHHETFRKILRKHDLTYIQRRLITFERVYKTDTKYLRENVNAKSVYFTTNVDLNEIREPFVERNVFEEHIFDEIEKKYGSDRQMAMWKFLKILMVASDTAILTLLDALFMIQLESLAEEIIHQTAFCISSLHDTRDDKKTPHPALSLTGVGRKRYPRMSPASVVSESTKASSSNTRCNSNRMENACIVSSSSVTSYSETSWNGSIIENAPYVQALPSLFETPLDGSRMETGSFASLSAYFCETQQNEEMMDTDDECFNSPSSRYECTPFTENYGYCTDRLPTHSNRMWMSYPTNRLSMETGDKISESRIGTLETTELANKYNSLYDNEWRNAFQILAKDHIEQMCAYYLLEIKKHIYSFCHATKATLLNAVVRLFVNPIPEGHVQEDISMILCNNKIRKIFESTLKMTSMLSIPNLQKSYQQSSTKKPELTNTLPEFVNKCIEICWLLNAQTPPLVFGEPLQSGQLIDRNQYNEYTTRGDVVFFVVWLPLLIEKNGAVLSKGVVHTVPLQIRPTTQHEQASIYGTEKSKPRRNYETRGEQRARMLKIPPVKPQDRDVQNTLNERYQRFTEPLNENGQQANDHAGRNGQLGQFYGSPKNSQVDALLQDHLSRRYAVNIGSKSMSASQSYLTPTPTYDRSTRSHTLPFKARIKTNKNERESNSDIKERQHSAYTFNEISEYLNLPQLSGTVMEAGNPHTNAYFDPMQAEMFEAGNTEYASGNKKLYTHDEYTGSMQTASGFSGESSV